jgi:hypothetical protein
MSIILVVMFVLFIHLRNFVIVLFIQPCLQSEVGVPLCFLDQSVNILQRAFIWLVYLNCDTLFMAGLVFLHRTGMSMMFVIWLICC